MQEHIFAAAVMIVLALSGADHSAVRWIDKEIACYSTCRIALDSARP